MFPEESIEKVFRIFVNKLLEKDKCEEGPQTADGRPRQERLSSLSGRQAVNEWETNQRIQTADGRPRQDRLSSLSGRQAVNEWETNKRIQTADGRPRQDRLSSLSGRQTVNEWENESTNSDCGRQTTAGQAFRPVGMEDRQRYGERIVTVQSCIKTVVSVIARSVLCDEAIPRLSSWPDKREIASPKKTARNDMAE
jgi:hypothetical protein